MARGYWVARVDIHDKVAYQKYVAANGPAFAKFGGRFLVRAGRFQVVEGTTRERNVVIEFPSYEAALACWHSPEYQAVLQLRTVASEADLVIFEGYDGAQPA
ncbi:DUF1330 domain-containing protein [Phreatobacter stygius]|uniref:DUF1330 domain-containing protein n=1 Tax=Phreatobacter stygius TaxID=1940610 RepID=A0A4D7AZ90_9HYPH|nr:DUF1330 domain-containing protein [Phreatobacter stygius]QCI64685.1 DUF1330 domain-containing protein [Phreatobacter stygius]